MVNNEELRQKIHDEKLKRIYARTRANQKKIEEKKNELKILEIGSGDGFFIETTWSESERRVTECLCA